MKTSFEMGQKVMNEEEMREYVEQEVRKALVNEGIDEGFLSDAWNKITQLLGALRNGGGNGGLLQMVGNYIKENMSLEEVLGFAVRMFGINAVLSLICRVLGIEINGPIGHAIKVGISAIGASATGNIGNNTTSLPSATAGADAGGAE